ncbi:glycosyltransferase family 4 protein [Eggerthella guodeyinii]|uniref:Glycosyltransferase n=1 Tax=Eggerthella guodeyinii TaxID=2690837 RepID=A0A6N7RS36_9ACTN|nr:glycosyltransferase family 4 protein [Eggerthella guodeyinii]MRX84086.1 glycosyltransferase [Eggerthella guodeyinii]
MNILAVCQHYWPEHFQITEVCEELVERGHKVTALVGIPNYPTGIVPEEYRNGKNREQVHNGVRIVRCNETPRKNGILGLAKNYLSYAASATRKVKKLDGAFDVVLAYQITPVLMAAPAAKMRRRIGTPMVLYCADIWPDAVKALLPEKFGFLMPFVKAVSTRIYRTSDAIATNSEAYIDCFEQVHGIDRRKLSYVPQYAEDSYLAMDLSAPPSSATRFLIMGNIGKLQDTRCVLEAVSLLKHRDDFLVHIVGTGSSIGECETYVHERGLDSHVVFHGRRPFEEMPEFYRMADACLLTLNVPGAPWISSTLPSRLQGYMAAGKPIIAAVNGSAGKVIEESQCGISVAAGNSAALAGAMEDFIENRGRYESCGEAGRAYFRNHFTKQRYMDDIERLLVRTAEGETVVQG